ncbi:MAG: class II aldolase/adducin family protein [Aigarchaeota archaeon]|nr:class II aldolase/adducin family protein [Candidatus Geocrenenecus dongiae]
MILIRYSVHDSLNMIMFPENIGASLLNVDRVLLDKIMEDVVYISKTLFEERLVKGTFGVVSERIPGTEYVVITPTGFKKGKIVKENLVIVDLGGRVVSGNLKPSTETPMHVFIHKNIKEANCVVHTHSPMATVFSILGREIPCVTPEQVFNFGGKIPIVKKYSYPGTTNIEELESIVEALKISRAALLPKHGVIVYGETAEEALDNAILVEDIATSTVFALILGQPEEFTEEEIRYLQKFKELRYGQKKP